MRLGRGALGVLVLLATLILGGCTGGWFTPKIEGALILSPASGGRFAISVTEIADGGLASIEIQTDPGFYSGMKDLSIAGDSGFEVISSSFDDGNGVMKLVAVRTVGGLTDGLVVELQYSRDGSPALDDTKLGAVVLGSDQNTYITHYDLVADKAYYTKEVEAN